MFYAFKDEFYTITAESPGPNCNPVIALFKSGEDEPFREVNFYMEGQEEQTTFRCPSDGIYYVRISQCNLDEEGCNAAYGEGSKYQLKVRQPYIIHDGMIWGSVTPPVPVTLTTTGMGGASIPINNDKGSYFMPHALGDFTPTAESENCEIFTMDFSLGSSQTDDSSAQDNEHPEKEINIELSCNLPADQPVYHSADYNPSDFQISLSELLRLLQLYNEMEYHCDPEAEDGYRPGMGDKSCPPHNSDYNPQDWKIDMGEFLRAIQLYSVGEYRADTSGEDGFQSITTP